MNYLRSTIITEAGHALIAKNQAEGTSPTFTHAEVGAGVYTEADTMDVIEQLTALRDPRQTFPLAGVEVRNKTNIYISFVATNHDDRQTLTEGTYPMLEMGIFANDPDVGEILYAVVLADTEHPDWMPTYNGLLPAVITYHVMIEVSNAENVQLTSGGGSFALADDLEAVRQVMLSLITGGTCTIPASVWQETDTGAVARIPIATVTANHLPQVVVSDASASDAIAAGMELIATTENGAVLVYADQAPTADIEISLALFRVMKPLVVNWTETEVTA